MHLSKPVLKMLIESQSLVTGFDDLDAQLTANGIDVRVCAIIEITNAGKLAINKQNNVSPKIGKVFVLPGYESRLDGYESEEIITTTDFVDLQAGKPYLIVTCEKLKMPRNMMAHLANRSSVFRFTQSTMSFGFIEAGFEGYLTFLLNPSLNGSIQLGARVAQVAFSMLTGESHYGEQKETNYQGGKIF